jgi:hypothetical protein
MIESGFQEIEDARIGGRGCHRAKAEEGEKGAHKWQLNGSIRSGHTSVLRAANFG